MRRIYHSHDTAQSCYSKWVEMEEFCTAQCQTPYNLSKTCLIHRIGLAQVRCLLWCYMSSPHPVSVCRGPCVPRSHADTQADGGFTFHNLFNRGKRRWEITFWYSSLLPRGDVCHFGPKQIDACTCFKGGPCNATVCLEREEDGNAVNKYLYGLPHILAKIPEQTQLYCLSNI